MPASPQSAPLRIPCELIYGCPWLASPTWVFVPRVENLPIDLDWWVYNHHYAETRFSWAYAALNVVYLLLGICGLFLRPRLAVWMFAYMLLRSALLLTVVPPEARYTLECFPMLFVLGGVAIGRLVPMGNSFTRDRRIQL